VAAQLLAQAEHGVDMTAEGGREWARMPIVSGRKRVGTRSRLSLAAVRMRSRWRGSLRGGPAGTAFVPGRPDDWCVEKPRLGTRSDRCYLHEMGPGDKRRRASPRTGDSGGFTGTAVTGRAQPPRAVSVGATRSWSATYAARCRRRVSTNVVSAASRSTMAACSVIGGTGTIQLASVLAPRC
jgi:hypothetical protein